MKRNTLLLLLAGAAAIFTLSSFSTRRKDQPAPGSKIDGTGGGLNVGGIDLSGLNLLDFSLPGQIINRIKRNYARLDKRKLNAILFKEWNFNPNIQPGGVSFYGVNITMPNGQMRSLGWRAFLDGEFPDAAALRIYENNIIAHIDHLRYGKNWGKTKPRVKERYIEAANIQLELVRYFQSNFTQYKQQVQKIKSLDDLK